MAAKKPQELHELFTKALNAGDLEGLVELYEPEAVLSSPEGGTAVGKSDIRTAYSNLLGMKGQITVETRQVFESKDGLALLHGKWSMTGTGPEGEIRMEGRNSEVARRQADGTWLFLIDNPFTPE